MNKYRIIQYITGVNKIHHIHYSYGYKVPFTKIAYFPENSFGIKHGLKVVNKQHYHNCTLTGIY